MARGGGAMGAVAPRAARGRADCTRARGSARTGYAPAGRTEWEANVCCWARRLIRATLGWTQVNFTTKQMRDMMDFNKNIRNMSVIGQCKTAAAPAVGMGIPRLVSVQTPPTQSQPHRRRCVQPPAVTAKRRNLYVKAILYIAQGQGPWESFHRP